MNQHSEERGREGPPLLCASPRCPKRELRLANPFGKATAERCKAETRPPFTLQHPRGPCPGEGGGDTNSFGGGRSSLCPTLSRSHVGQRRPERPDPSLARSPQDAERHLAGEEGQNLQQRVPPAPPQGPHASAPPHAGGHGSAAQRLPKVSCAPLPACRLEGGATGSLLSNRKAIKRLIK